MGSSLSGNRGGRPTVEGCRVLDINRLRDQEVCKPGHHTSGLYGWKDSITGEQTASVSYEAKVDRSRGLLRLIYTSTVRGTSERRSSDYTISLTTTAQPFGGERWWFLCPRTGIRVSKLYLPYGAYEFASRKAYRLGYGSQRETPRDRALRRAFKLRRQLGADGGIGDVIVKPPGMHQATFERKFAAVCRAEAICDAYLASFVDRFRGQFSMP